MVWLLLLAILLIATAQASDSLVINHVITDRIIKAEDGLYIGKVLLGFTVGRAQFYTITQIMLEQGFYQGHVVIEDPAGKLLSQVQFGEINAETDNWLHSLIATWEVEFKQPGIHKIVIYINKLPTAKFLFLVKQKT